MEFPNEVTISNEGIYWSKTCDQVNFNSDLNITLNDGITMGTVSLNRTQLLIKGD
jgi:hypothetical protein